MNNNDIKEENKITRAFITLDKYRNPSHKEQAFQIVFVLNQVLNPLNKEVIINCVRTQLNKFTYLFDAIDKVSSSTSTDIEKGIESNV